MESLALQSFGPRAVLWLPPALAKAALAHCEEAAKLDPALLDARAFAALARFIVGERVNAIDEALAVVKKRKVPGWPDLVAAFLLRQSGRASDANDVLTKAIAAAPGFLHARILLGESLSVDGKLEDAERVLTATLAIAPDTPWVLALLGKVRALRGDVDGAVALADRALALAPDDPVLLLEKASRQIDAARFADAEQTLRLALVHGPRIAALYVRLGYVYLVTDQAILAKPILLKALYEADRESERRVKGYAHYDLAKLAARDRDDARALAELDRAVRAGFAERTRFEADPDLKRLASDPAFVRIFEAPIP
jgi:tetratricopeptide (TPR) repeat protein